MNLNDNVDINQRLINIEARLNQLSATRVGFDASPASDREEIDLREIWNILWGGKWWILSVTFCFAIAGLFYGLSLPNKYKSEGVYAPSQKQDGITMGGSLGGLASLTGVSLAGGRRDDIDQAIALLNSWPFLEKVIEKYKLKPLILGLKGWHSETGELVWNSQLYDSKNNNWIRKPPKGKEAEPSSYEAYFAMRRMINFSYDAKTSMLSLSVQHYSPKIAKEWVDMLIEEINNTFRERSINESTKNINFLEKRVSETSISEMQSVFYGMIESQMKTLMLAEVGEEFLLKEVVSPKVAEEKSGPAKLLILGFFIVIGGMLSLAIVMIRAFMFTSERDEVLP